MAVPAHTLYAVRSPDQRMAAHRLSLAQQIADLDEPAPADVDPEDDRAISPPPFDNADGREHYLDVGLSSLRKLQDSIADPKYDGVKTSRKQLMEDTEAEEDEDQDKDQYTQQESDGEDVDEDADEDEEVHDQDNVQDEDESISGNDQGKSNSKRSTPPSPAKRKERDEDAENGDDLSSTLRQKRDEDRTKGKAVARQIALWDNLLDARIRLQKSVAAANRLPLPTEIPSFLANSACLKAQHALLDEALQLSDELSLMREGLMVQDGVEVRPRKRRRRTRVKTEIDNGAADRGVDLQNASGEDDYEAAIREEGEWASGLEHAYHAHLTRTLAKWSAKIAAVAPSALLPSSRAPFSQKGAAARDVKSVPVQVDDAMQTDGEKLRARVRVKRGKRARVRWPVEGEDGAQEDGQQEGENDVEVFDDTDFYQELLRDVLDSRGQNGGGDDWMTTQRQKKAKKSVDTKASKGRKLRYEVQEKIQNFMVPVPLAGGGWHEAQIDELFASLLGRGFESAPPVDGIDGDAPTDVGTAVEVSGDTLKGLRVFG